MRKCRPVFGEVFFAKIRLLEKRKSNKVFELIKCTTHDNTTEILHGALGLPWKVGLNKITLIKLSMKVFMKSNSSYTIQTNNCSGLLKKTYAKMLPSGELNQMHVKCRSHAT